MVEPPPCRGLEGREARWATWADRSGCRDRGTFLPNTTARRPLTTQAISTHPNMYRTRCGDRTDRQTDRQTIKFSPGPPCGPLELPKARGDKSHLTTTRPHAYTTTGGFNLEINRFSRLCHEDTLQWAMDIAGDTTSFMYVYFFSSMDHIMWIGRLLLGRRLSFDVPKNPTPLGRLCD